MRRAYVVVLALLAGLVTTVSHPAVSRADVPPSDTDRFVTLWDTRFHQQDSFQAYLDSDQQYDDGFNGYAFEDKVALVDALVAYWEANEPGFRDGIDYSTPPGALPPMRAGDPDETYPEYLPDGALPTREWVVYFVYQLVFDKAAFKQRMLQETIPPGAGLDPKSIVNPGSAGPPSLPDGRPQTPLDSVLNLIQSTLVAAEDVYDEHRPVDAGDVAIPSPTSVAPSFSRTFSPWPATSASTLSGAPRRPRTARRGSLPQGLSTDFVAYAQQEGSATVYQATGSLLPLSPPAKPGNLVDVDLSVIDLGVAYQVRLHVHRIDPALSHVHAWVYYQPAPLLPVLRLGFGGSDDGSAPYVALQENQSIDATFDIPALAGVAVRLSSTVTHDGPPSAVDVAAEYGYATSTSGPDVALARATIAKAPASIELDVCHTLVGSAVLPPCAYAVGSSTQLLPLGTSVSDIRVVHSASTPPRLGVLVRSNGTNTRTVAKATLPELAKWVTVRLESSPESVQGPATTTVIYGSQTAMADVSGDVRVVTQSPGEPSSHYRHAAVRVASLPTSIKVTVQPKSVAYEANDSVAPSTAGEDALTVSYDSGIAGTPDAVYLAAEIHASNVPKQVAMTLPLDSSQQQQGQVAPRIYTLTMGGGPYQIDSLSGRFRDYAAQIDVHAAARGIPVGTGTPGATYTLQIATSGHPETIWTGAGIDQLTAWGSYQNWQFSATVLHTPTYFRLGKTDRAVVVDGTNAGGSEVTGWLTNTGTVLALPAGYTNAVVGEMTLLPSSVSNPAAVLVSFAVHVVGISHVAVAPGDPKATPPTPTTFDVHAGAGGTFYVWAKVHDQTVTPVRHGLLSAVVTDFPGAITGTMGDGLLDVTTSNNPTLQAYLEWGSAAALLLLPPVPSVHGLAMRDVKVPNNTATAARIYLTGLPSHVHIDPSTILVTGFKPTVNRLQVDLLLISDPLHTIRAYADLQNIPTGAASTFNISYSVTRASSNEQTISASLTASAPMGPLFLLKGGAVFAAYAEVSNVPSTMTLWAHDAEDTQTMTWNAAQRIDSINVAFGAPGIGVPIVARGTLHLHEIPRNFLIKVFTDKNGGGARYDYVTTDPVDPTSRLDVTAAADGSLVSATAVVAASFYFEIVDLGTSSSLVQPAGSHSIVLLSDRLTKLKAVVSALVKEHTTNPGPQSSGWIRLGYQQDIDVESAAAFLTIEADDVSSLVIDRGVSTRFAGDFSSFRIGWAALLVKVDAQLQAGIQIKIIKWWTISLIPPVQMSTLYLPVTLHAYTSGDEDAFTAPIGWTGRTLHVVVRPKPCGIASAGIGMTLSGTVGGQTTYYLTPNVLWPAGSFLTRLITAIYWSNGAFKVRVT